MSARDDILRKVQALLRLAEGTDSAEESAAALAKAMRMMDEYGIDADEAREFIPSEHDFQRRIKIPRKWDRANIMAQAICEQYFSVKCSFHWTHLGPQVVISGQEHRVLFACHIFELLRLTVTRLWASRVRRSRKRIGRISFIVGFGRGIATVLERERQTYTGIMKDAIAKYKRPSEPLTDDTKKFLDDIQREAAYQHGLAHGLATKIRKPLDGGSSDHLQLAEAVA